MKKKTLLTICSTLVAVSMAANVTLKVPSQTQLAPIESDNAVSFDFDTPVPNPVIAASSDKITSLDFHYCGTAQTAIRPGNGNEVENSTAIKLPKEWLEHYKGCKITEVKIMSGFNGQTLENYITDATVFISNDIFESEPVYTQRAKLSKKGMTWNDIALKTPYEIIGDNDVYVGYTVVRPGEYDAPFCVDRIPNTQKCSFWVNYEIDGERVWEDWSDTYGSVCMHLTIEGETMPNNDMTVTDLKLPNMVGLNNDFVFTFRVTNHGANVVNNFTVEYTFGTNKSEPMVISVPGGLAYNDGGIVEARGTASVEGTSVPFTVKVTKVNGMDDIYTADNEVTGYIFVIDPSLGFMRTMLFEEGTGTWCGWCPRGTAAISYMNEHYTDGSFIGIAYHQGDPMQVTPQSVDFEHGFGNHFLAAPSYPNARYNRIKSYGNEIASIDAVNSIYNELRKLPAIANVDFSLYFTDDNKDELTVVGTTEFAISSDAGYRVAYVLVEDNLGPYVQSNYYSGSTTPMGGWENMSRSASVMFDHVGRYITSFNGEENTVPATVERGEKYAHQTVIPLDRLMNGDINYASVVGIVINQSTGEVENASIVHCSENLPLATGIDDLIADEAEGKTEWFTIQGIRVSEPTSPGIYVKVSGGKAEKIIIK